MLGSVNLCLPFLVFRLSRLGQVLHTSRGANLMIEDRKK
jgi:hypothetical protein